MIELAGPRFGNGALFTHNGIHLPRRVRCDRFLRERTRYGRTLGRQILCGDKGMTPRLAR
jgi:hypothetical protein